MGTTTSTPTDIDAGDERGRTKIYLAAEAGDAAEVARLFELQADFDLLSTGFFRYHLSLFKDEKFINFIVIDQNTGIRHFMLLAKWATHQLFVCCSKPARIKTRKTDTGLWFDLNEFMTSID